MKRRNNRVLALGAVMTTVAMLTAGCLSGGDDGGDGGGGGGTSSVDGGTDDGDGIVEVIGAFGGTEGESFEREIKAFEDENGIDIQYTGTQDFQTIISSKVRAGDTPDIGIFPQPGTLVDLGEDGDVAPVDEYLDVAALEETLIPGLLDAGAGEDGTFYGAPMRVAVKSVVFVPQEAYASGGYSTEPASIQELAEIADQIKADGIAPWCIGYGSDAATGWVGTDWIEEFMLRLHGPEVYDQWVSHEIPFDAPEVQEAFEAYADIVKTEGNVRGGGQAVINTRFEEAGNPVLGGGDLAASFNPDDEETTMVMEYLTSEGFGQSWAAEGGWLSPHTTFDTSLYPDEVTRSVGEIAANADVFRFDASDLMPTEVGGGSFWTGMVEWTAGDKTTEEVTQEIEASWPSS